VAVTREPVRLNDAMRDAYRYQPVVFHSPVFHSQAAPTGRLRTTVNAVREV
jgi:hypothetical protein